MPEMEKNTQPLLEITGLKKYYPIEAGIAKKQVGLVKAVDDVTLSIRRNEVLGVVGESGVNPENVYQAIRGGLAGSTVMDAKAPMMLDRNFDPGFRIELHIKDLTNAMNASQAVDMELPMTEKVLEMMKILAEEGMGKCDHSAVLRYYEEQESVEVKR